MESLIRITLTIEIHLVVDHRSDQAWDVVHDVKSRFDRNNRLTIHEMLRPLDTCGLKCSALIQALNAIRSDAEYIVLLDADVTPHRSWLADVTAPLSDQTIGFVTGNQWFEPPESANSGTLLRSLWNAGAIVPTAMFNNPWAGSCAMRVADARRAELEKVWRHSVVDDGPIRKAFKPLGLKIYFEPRLIMVNREECTFPYVNSYISRMLTWSKLYEKTYVNTSIHAAFSSGTLVAALVLTIAGVVESNFLVAAISAGSIATSALLSGAGYWIVRSGVVHNCAKRGEELGSASWAQMFQLVCLTPVVQVVYGVSCFRALIAQQVKWRQITYVVESDSQVRMLRYRPHKNVEQDFAQSKVSI